MDFSHEPVRLADNHAIVRLERRQHRLPVDDHGMEIQIREDRKKKKQRESQAYACGCPLLLLHKSWTILGDSNGQFLTVEVTARGLVQLISKPSTCSAAAYAQVAHIRTVQSTQAVRLKTTGYYKACRPVQP